MRVSTRWQARLRRLLPHHVGPAAVPSQLPIGRPDSEAAWLEPYPDADLPDVANEALGPEARYEMHESIQLAFVAAMQQLPPRQRAVLLLRDVLGWSANETAELLGSSVASVNSALQRARATVDARTPSAERVESAAQAAKHQDLLERYVSAWEASDIDGLVTLLREDAVLSMPPWRLWYRGRDGIRQFLEWGMRHDRRFRLVATRANGQPAFGQYMWRAEDPAGPFIGVVPQAINLFSGSILDNLTLDDRSVPLDAVESAAHITGFDQLVRTLPASYATELGGAGRGAGVQLSAGQQQLLALTRALVWDPPVILLDEATSAIDNASDAAFRSALQAIVKEQNRAVLTIAHRLSTARDADRVVVLDMGRVVEEGSPRELLSAGGYFAALLELEASGWDWQVPAGVANGVTTL